ncbi:MAG: ABC transporter permease subunit [Chloroflexaceae bacterium]|jgi:putative spermidine/putrescine transport system permease protein|nr:ABC transporter permease subunit [Chloroflexaceae bacterium]
MPRLRWFAILAVVVWTLLPLLPLPLWSFSGGWRWPALLPERWSSRAWAFVLSPEARALPALFTSLALALLVTLLALAAGLPAALALGRTRFRGRALVELLIFAPILVPPLTVAMGVQVLFIRLGLADTLAGVALVHLVFSLPYVVLILASAVAGLSATWEEQARSLGATRWRAFWHVTLPLLRPSLAVAALLAFLVSWSQYALTLLIGGGNVFTLPLLVFAAARGSDPALTAATALLFIAPTLAFLALASRNLDERNGGVGLL